MTSAALRDLADRLGGGGGISRLFDVNDRAGRRWLAEPDRTPAAVEIAAEIVEAVARGEPFEEIAAKCERAAVLLRLTEARRHAGKSE